MSLKKERFIKGIILAPDTLSLDGIEGEIKVDSSTGKIQVTLKDGANPSASREILTSSQTQTLTNKTLTSPVIDTGVSGSAIDIDGTLAANSDTKLASQKAVKTYVDAQIGSKDEADEIIYDNTTSGLVATNVQTAIDEVDGNVDNLVSLSGVALDSTTLGTFTGVTIPDSSTVKSALQAIETSHESHTGASSGVHGVAGSVVGTSDSQALTNKTIDADLNTISNIENADIKVGANIARSKLASGTANRVVVNDATGVQTDAAAITAARVLISDANGIPTHSSVTSTTLGYVDATSSIQNQLDAKVDESGGTLTNGSVITPARLDVKQDTKANLTTYALTAANGQLCFATDTKEMFQIVDGLLESVGGGAGIGGVDILFSQTFEEAALTDFTQTGLSLSTSSPLHGEISALLTHDSSISQSFKQVIPVDNKFRNQTMVLRLDVKSNASAGNVVINIYDETNAANIVASEQLQLANDVNGKKTSVSFTIPETCASLSYTITALPEAGSPTTRIDDIICELAETALLETAVEVPVVTAWQGYTPTFQGFGSPTNIEFEYRQVGENVEIRGKFTAGTTTAVEARVGLPAGLTSASTSLIPSIKEIGVGSFGNTTASQAIILIEPSVSYLTIGLQSSTGSGLSKINGSTLLSSSQQLSFFASVPCSGLSATTTKTIPLTQSGLVQEADSYLLAKGNAGQSITVNVTDIPFTAVSNQGSAISFNGSSVTALLDGVYSFDIGVVFTASLGRRLSIYVNNILTYETASASDTTLTSNITLNLQSGDVVKFRVSGNGGTLNNAAIYHYLNVSHQGSLKQVSVNPNSKITIPTSELRFEGASARGSTATAIVRFDTIAKLRGDAFTVESDAVLGTRITMKKAGKLDVSVSLAMTANTTAIISKNQTNLTSGVPLASESLARTGSGSGANSFDSASWSGFLSIGDVIRVSAEGNPINVTTNNLNLSFQEQDISVSVTNTLPQFSDSDSSVRVTGGNSFTGQTRLFSNVIQNIGSDVQYTAASGQFRAMSSGIYNITYQEESAVSSTGPEIYIYVNETLTAIANDRINTAASLTRYPLASIQLYLSEGDIVTGRVSVTGNFPSVSTYSSMTISKVGKPNVTGVDVTPFVNVPQPETQSITRDYSRVSGGGAVFTGALTATSGASLLSYNSTTGIFTANKRVTVEANLVLRANAGSTVTGYINTKLGTVAASSSPATANTWSSAAYSGLLEIGDTLVFGNSAAGAPSYDITTINATALSDQILTAPETFSTDTAALKYAGSASYTLSTLQNAPVGTFITFTYAANTNTRTQTTTRPTQTDADMNANGIQIFPRAYNAASTSGNPSAIAIQIGKGLKGFNLSGYAASGKSGDALQLDFFQLTTTTVAGLRLKAYSETTGILLMDAALNSATVTTAVFENSAGGSQTSGYLVINASKNPALTGLGLNTVVARGVNSAGTTYANSETVLVYDSTKTYDTHGALNTSTGVFTAPESGYYQVSAAVMFNGAAYITTQFGILNVYKNGTWYATLNYPVFEASTTNVLQMQGSTGIFLAKGDTVSIFVRNSRGSTALSSNSERNYFSIHKTNIGTGN